MTWEPVKPELRGSARLVASGQVLVVENILDIHYYLSPRQPTASSAALCMTTSVRIFPHRSARQEIRVEIFDIFLDILCDKQTD